MARLTTRAREELRAADVTPKAWARRFFGEDTWGGDTCGCPDDRCAGHHHDEDDECGCLRALLDD